MTKTIALKIEMKAVLLFVAAVLLSFFFISTVHAASFTKDLKVGSEGDEVVALQTLLEEKGFLVMPAGVSKGYFGGKTQAALAKYQASLGITPAVGYFGPLTRGKIMSGANANNTVGISNNASTPVITKLTFTAPNKLSIEGKGFSTSSVSGKANSVVVFNALGTKQITFNQIVSVDGNTLSLTTPVDWLTGETPVAQVKNETTGKVSAAFPVITLPTSVSGGSSGNSSSGGGSVAPTPSPTSNPGS